MNETTTTGMRALIARLFTEAPKLETIAGVPDQGQRPAMLCNVIVRGITQPMSGVLSTTDEDTLKLMTPVKGKAGESDILLEQFFRYDDVVVIALHRNVQASSLWSAPS